MEQLPTVQGLLQIDHVGTSGYGLFVAGHFIAELESFSVLISSALPAADSVQYVLVKIATGGGSCPHLYRLVDLTPGRNPYLTGEFGNCSAVPVFRMDGETIAIDFSDFAKSKAQTFLYNPKRRHIVRFAQTKGARK